MANTGMLSGLFAAPTRKDLMDEEKQEDQELRYLANDGIAAANYASYEGARQAGRGLGRVAAGSMGLDPRTKMERGVDAVEKAKQELGAMDLDPTNADDYYKKVIDTLRKNGLFAEAHAAAQEWNKHKNDQTDDQLKRDDLERKREEAKRKAAIAEEANRIKALRAQQLAQQGMPEFIQIVDRIEREQNPTVRKLLMDRANQQAGGKVKFEDAGDRVIVRNERGDILGVDQMGEKPMNEKDRLKNEQAKKNLEPAYRSAMLTMQTQYKAAADLYNSPGLDDLIGKWTGLAAQYGMGSDGMLTEAAVARLSPEGQEALGIYQQIMGGAFVNALKTLKEAGGGSTGLGQVTEVEGKKITVATNALFPRQQPASFRRKLQDYISTLEQSAEILRDKAKSDGLAPIDLNIVELTGPIKGKAATPAPTAPRAAPRAPLPTGDNIRVRRKADGKEGVMPRSGFNPEKYEEIK